VTYIARRIRGYEASRYDLTAGVRAFVQDQEPVLGEFAEVASHAVLGGTGSSDNAMGLSTKSSPKSPAAQAQRRRAVEAAVSAVHAFMAPSNMRIGR
jgi:hypothetical protein